MDKFLPSIKHKYKDRLINREKQWPPCHSNKLVRLELVERKKGAGYSDNIQRGSDDKTVERTTLSYGDMFKVESGKKPVRKVLVEGDAGIGKTTLSVSISEDWSCEKLYQEFELVLLLPLRYKKVVSAGSLPELLKLLHPSADVCKSVASYLEEEEAKKVLVIADGWDELSESERQEGSFLYELLFETFPLMSVVVTSRPSASAPLHRLPCFDRFVEINGFGNDDIKEYIHCEFSTDHEKACRLLEQLEDNPLVESVCSVPLNCAIVCHLWRTSEEVLPSSMTQIYKKMILNVILRNMHKKDSFKSVLGLPNFDALPKELQQSFRLLCQFAFKALKENQIVFSQQELVEFFPEGLALDEKILCFGLLQSAETVLETGHGVSFHFLHLTFMEYLAALYLSKQLQRTLLGVNNQTEFDKIIKLLGYNFRGTNCFNIVWMFSFGIIFSGCKLERKDMHIKVLQYVSLEGYNRLCLCHCAFESQNYSIVHEVIQYLQKQPSVMSLSQEGIWYESNFGYLRTAYDFEAVLYVMANMEECSDMVLDLSRCHVKENQIRRLTNILASKQRKLKVAKLSLSGCKLTGGCVKDLFHRASAAFKPEIDLIKSCSIPRKGVSLLDMSYNPIGASEMQSLEKVVCDHVYSNLNYLSLKGCLTCDVDTKSIADTNATSLTTFIEALSTNCPHIHTLNLSSNNLGVAGASVVAKGVSRFKMYLHVPYYPGPFFQLYLDDNSFNDEGFKAFIDNLDGRYMFRDLSLRGNSIHAAGVSYLVESFCSRSYPFHKYHGIHLCDNPLGLEGAIAVGKMLSSSHCQFENIDLCRCKLTTSGSAFSNTDSVSHTSSMSSESTFIDIGKQLCQMPQNKTVIHLDLSGNCFSGEGIHVLLGIIHQCSCLEYLQCEDCEITSDDLILLLNKTINLKKLVYWKLNKNQIKDSGVSALIDHLQLLFNIKNCYSTSYRFDISLWGNPVSKEMMRKLDEELNRIRKTVSYLDLIIKYNYLSYQTMHGVYLI